MPLAQWALLLGLLLLGMVAIGTLLGRLPLTAAMVYLTLGALLSPLGTGVLHVHPIEMAATLERAAEAALLISLFAVGLQLGVPIASFRWRLPLKLAFVSLGAMVAMIALVGALFLNLSPGAAVLLGAILAPTDPVLASGVPSEPGERPDRLGFSLAAEGGLNDGAA
jgi:NhaP-type Na+/H+ or K+/H+ antiporter